VGEPSDEELILQYQEQNSAVAFRTIYLRYRVKTFNFILHLVKENGTAEDLHQECWLHIIDAARKWRPSGAFRAWLFQVFRNRCLDHFRAVKRSPIEEDEDELIEKAEASVPEPGDISLREAVLQCIGSLNASQRQVFYLKAIESMTFAEITELMASAPGLANRRMQLAVAHLRACLLRKGIRED
jgi:RNA polymerase sigma factor (sigma-70 family)